MPKRFLRGREDIALAGAIGALRTAAWRMVCACTWAASCRLRVGCVTAFQLLGLRYRMGETMGDALHMTRRSFFCALAASVVAAGAPLPVAFPKTAPDTWYVTQGDMWFMITTPLHGEPTWVQLEWTAQDGQAQEES